MGSVAPNRMSALINEELVEGGKAKLDSLKGGTEDVIAYREQLIQQLELVDDYLVQVAQKIQDAVAGPQHAAAVEAEPRAKASAGVRSRREPNKMRNGKVTDTWKVWDFLRTHGKPITRAELLPHTKKMGIENEESALYSLRVSKLITRENGLITLTDD